MLAKRAAVYVSQMLAAAEAAAILLRKAAEDVNFILVDFFVGFLGTSEWSERLGEEMEGTVRRAT